MTSVGLSDEEHNKLEEALSRGARTRIREIQTSTSSTASSNIAASQPAASISEETGHVPINKSTFGGRDNTSNNRNISTFGLAASTPFNKSTVGRDSMSNNSGEPLLGPKGAYAQAGNFFETSAKVFNSRPCFFLNAAVLLISIAFFTTAYFAVLPMTLERALWLGTLNDTTTQMELCHSEYLSLETAHNATILKLTEANEKVDDLNGNITLLQSVNADLDTQLAVLTEANNKKMDELKNEKYSLDAQVSAQDKEITQLKSQLKACKETSPSIWCSTFNIGCADSGARATTPSSFVFVMLVLPLSYLLM